PGRGGAPRAAPCRPPGARCSASARWGTPRRQVSSRYWNTLRALEPGSIRVRMSYRCSSAAGGSGVLLELGEAPGEALPAGGVPAARGWMQRPPVHLLQAVAQHRPVGLGEQVQGDLHPVVGADAEHVLVIGTVVDLAQREPVVHS